MRSFRQAVSAFSVPLLCRTRLHGSQWSPSLKRTFVAAGLSSSLHSPLRTRHRPKAKTNRSPQAKTGVARRTKTSSQVRKSQKKELRKSLSQHPKQQLLKMRMTLTHLQRTLTTTVRQPQLSRRKTRRQRPPRRRQPLWPSHSSFGR